METRLLSHLLAAVESRNLVKACEKTEISQSGMSRSIRTLEDRMGVPILVRGPRGVEPTVYGQLVMERGRVILNEVARLLDEVKALSEGRVGTVRFGITHSYAGYLVPAVLAALHADHPKLRVVVIAEGFVDLAEKVRAEQIDFGFGLIGPIRDGDRVRIEPLDVRRSRIFARSGHPLSARKRISTLDLAGAQWAMSSCEGVLRAFASFFETQLIAPPTPMLRSNSIALIRRLVLDTDALTVLPEDVLEADIAAVRIVALDSETPVEDGYVGLFYRHDGMLTPQAAVIAQALRQGATG